jgi:hypothetical protein
LGAIFAPQLEQLVGTLMRRTGYQILRDWVSPWLRGPRGVDAGGRGWQALPARAQISGMSLGCTQSPASSRSCSRADARAWTGSPCLAHARNRALRPAPRTGRAWRAALGLALGCSLGACADGFGDDYGSGAFVGDGSLGTPGAPIRDDAGTPDASDATATDTGFTGEGVRLRVHQGVLNLAHAQICHDPDLQLDDPNTDADESANGPLLPVALPLSDAGSVGFGETTDYVLLPAMATGAITIHRASAPDAGTAPDAGAATDAAAPAVQDAGVASDASLDAAARDAAAASDASGPDAASPCDLASLEAVLPLPTTSAWFAPEQSPDAAVDLERLGFITTAADGDSLTLFGSGLALDAAELARRSAAARQAYLAMDPDDPEGAEAEGRSHVRSLESSYGARFLLARGVAPAADRFALSLAHLVPDVPSTPTVKPGSDAGTYAGDAGTGMDAGSGALHLCVTVDQKESEPGDGGLARFEFRSVSGLGNQFDPHASYRFRLFVEAEYQQGQSSCATTSLRPVARLDVDAGTFEPNRSYTLIATGAVAPASVCTSVNSSSLIRQTCARPVDALNAQLQYVPNELPAAP